MLSYRLKLEPDDNGTVLVTSPDLPIVTYGHDEAAAMRNAADAIDTLVDSMMRARENVPCPGDPGDGGALSHRVSLQTEMKIRLHQAMLAAGWMRAELARRLDWTREAVDRLFRLDHNSRLDQIEQAFRSLGRTVDVEVRTAA